MGETSSFAATPSIEEGQHSQGLPEVRELRTEEEEDLFRFRYDIYVAEMGRKQLHADHERRRIEEPLDAHAFHLVAVREGSIVGALRLNWALDEATAHYRELYSMVVARPWYPAQTTMITKFMIRRELRRSALALRMCEATYEWGYRHGSRFDFIDCNSHLRPFFTRLGYRQIKPDVVHPEYGRVHPLV